MEPSSSQQFSQRIYWGIAFAVFLAAVILLLARNRAFYSDFQSYFSMPPPASPPAVSPYARVTIDFGNGNKRAFQGEAQTGMTIFSALAASERTGKFKVVTDDAGHVTAIGGVTNNGEQSWKLYINGTFISDVPGRIELKAGDKIIFKYE